MRKISPWVYRVINRSGEKLTKEEIEAIPIGRNPINIKCRCCGERFATQRGLVSHYMNIHPDLDRGWIDGKEDEVSE